MKRRLLWPSWWAVLAFFEPTPNTVEAQCFNTIQYPYMITTLDQTTTTPVTISTCNSTTQYSVVLVNSSGIYTFTVTENSSGISRYVTLTDALSNLIAHGPSPLQASIPGTGQYRVHWTDNAACNGSWNCYTTTAVLTNFLGGCIPPLGITAAGITSTSANVSWTASTSNPANGYEYVITTTYGTPTGSGTATTATSFTATALTPNTQYFVYVRAMCANGTSLWNFSSFLTLCLAVTAPWTEDFEGPTFSLNNTFNSCWTTIPVSAQYHWYYSWWLENGYTFTSNTGPSADHTTGVPFAGKYIYTETNKNSAGQQAEIGTPWIDISGITNPELRFWKHFYGAHIDSFFVEVDTGSGFQTIFATHGPGPQIAETDPWVEEVLSLNPFTGSTALQIRFRAISGGVLVDLALDDISVGPPCFMNVGIAAISASCFGTNNGTAAVTASGGTPPYSYLWNTGDITPTLSNLTAGQYQVTVTDAGGCAVSINTTVTQNTAISAIIIQDNVDCFGGSNGWAILNVSGGTPPYSYLWNTGDLTSTLSSLTAGLYQITVTDAHGCTIDNQVVITEPAELVVMVDIVPPDAAVANVTGGSPPYTYVWSTNPPQTTLTATGLPPGTYTVTVTDASGCSATWDFMIGMEEPGFAQYIDLYPNPTTDGVFIDYNFTGEVDLEVTVMNHLGQVVLTISEPNAISGQFRLEVAEWASGIYNVLFSNGSQSNSRQLVIQK